MIFSPCEKRGLEIAHSARLRKRQKTIWQMTIHKRFQMFAAVGWLRLLLGQLIRGSE